MDYLGVRRQKTDLGLTGDEYNQLKSDDDYDDNEKLMLQKAAQRRSKIDFDKEDSEEEEVFGLHESEDEEAKNEPLGDEMYSDIEEKDGENDNILDLKAWGTKRKNYYNTDYIDQDYGGFSKAEEEEAALLEEEEAREIQKRLISELDNVDFSLGILPSDSSNKINKAPVLEEEQCNEVIETDISRLSKREKLVLLEKESPEFRGLVSDFEGRMSYARDYLEPIMNLVKSEDIPVCPATKLISIKYHITLNYCSNIVFYLLLKSKREKVVTHPVVKRLVQFRNLLKEMDHIYRNVIELQIMEILKIKERGKKLKRIQLKTIKQPVLSGNRAARRRMFSQLVEQDTTISKNNKIKTFENMQLSNDTNDTEAKDLEAKSTREKRSITYEIAKNKGLTPKRKKENRNPRVKHRKKFLKATVRRKGQVRGVYKETTRYSSEPFGIKASVSKSIKLK